MSNVDETEVMESISPDEVLVRTQNEILNYSVVEGGNVDRGYSELVKAYSDLYAAHEHASSEICKNNNEAVKIEYDNEYRKDELKFKKKELEIRKQELDIRRIEMENRFKEYDLKERELEIKDADLRIRSQEIEDREAAAEKEFKQKKREAFWHMVFEITKIVLSVGSTATMIVMHERDKKYNDEDMLTNPESKEHTKRMWSGILSFGKK